MKKYIYTAAFAILAIVSCAKDDTKDVNKGRKIDFRVATTRATETTTDNLNGIWVTAISENGNAHFSKVQFTKENNYFVTPNAYYWPSDGSDLKFYAFAPSEELIGAEALTIDGTTQLIKGFTPASAIKDQIDLIVADGTGNKDNSANGAELVFDHALTQVEIRAYSNNTGYKHLVKGVRIGKVVSVGDLNLYDKTWDHGTEKSNYEITYDTPIELKAEAQSLMNPEANGNAMIIPQKLIPWDVENDKTNTLEGAYIAVKVNITTADGAIVFPSTAGEYEWVAFPIDTELIRGFKYTYKLDFSNGSGYVDPEKPVDPTDPTNPTNPGEQVLGGKIQFTHYIYGWSSSSTDIEM